MLSAHIDISKGELVVDLDNADESYVEVIASDLRWLVFDLASLVAELRSLSDSQLAAFDRYGSRRTWGGP